MKLRNRTNRAIIINLDHDIVCAEGECLCSHDTHRGLELDPKTGETGVRETERLICKSVHVMPRETSEELPAAVEKLPKVAAALKSRTLIAAE